MEGEKPKKCRAGTVRPVAEKVVELRGAKGWSQQELADKVRLSIRTIQNLESGECCYVITLRQIAGAFGLTDVTPLMPNTVAEPPKADDEKRTDVVVTVSIPPEQFDYTRQLRVLASALLILTESEGTIDVKSAGEGKSQITFDMRLEDAFMLSQYLKSRRHQSLQSESGDTPLTKREKMLRWAESIMKDVKFPEYPILDEE